MPVIFTDKHRKLGLMLLALMLQFFLSNSVFANADAEYSYLGDSFFSETNADSKTFIKFWDNKNKKISKKKYKKHVSLKSKKKIKLKSSKNNKKIKKSKKSGKSKKSSEKKFATKTGSYAKYKNSKSFLKSFAIYENSKLLAKANKANTKIRVDLSEQRVKLLVNNKVALDSPATTGSKNKKDRNTGEVKDKRTPKGSFKIQEKIKDKRSSIFGRLYKKGKLVYTGDKRKYKGEFDKYEGSSLSYWMRLTGDGIGLHLSKGIKRSPASNGCIRLPAKVVENIFSKVKVGTKVEVSI